MQLAVVAAGFTPGEADQLRRAMAAWRTTGDHRPVPTRSSSTACSPSGYTREFAERVFKQIRGFGEYGFPESHAASFALLVYVSALAQVVITRRRSRRRSSTASRWASMPRPSSLRNAKQHGVEVRPVDVNHSDWDCTLEPAAASGPAAVRLGLCMISGLSETFAARIVEARRQGEFHSVAELARRAGLEKPVLARLARADAFGSFPLDRRQNLWQALEQPEAGPLDQRTDTPPPPGCSPP